ncbi:MAG TPA: hypothetical protein VK963_01775 [Candidatus Saccharimonadales bacterium]|nr:hypothetical protein [Candidatus Saccharimonadales bacterium]
MPTSEPLKLTFAIIREHRSKGEYLDSREIAGQALEIMKDNDWRSAVIVAHPYMMARNDYLCAALGIKTIARAGLENIVFDSESAQVWIRNAEAWWEREESVIDFCYAQGWLAVPQV